MIRHVNGPAVVAASIGPKIDHLIAAVRASSGGAAPRSRQMRRRSVRLAGPSAYGRPDPAVEPAVLLYVESGRRPCELGAGQSLLQRQIPPTRWLARITDRRCTPQEVVRSLRQALDLCINTHYGSFPHAVADVAAAIPTPAAARRGVHRSPRAAVMTSVHLNRMHEVIPESSRVPYCSAIKISTPPVSTRSVSAGQSRMVFQRGRIHSPRHVDCNNVVTVTCGCAQRCLTIRTCCAAQNRTRS